MLLVQQLHNTFAIAAAERDAFLFVLRIYRDSLATPRDVIENAIASLRQLDTTQNPRDAFAQNLRNAGCNERTVKRVTDLTFGPSPGHSGATAQSQKTQRPRHATPRKPVRIGPKLAANIADATAPVWLSPSSGKRKRKAQSQKAAQPRHVSQKNTNAASRDERRPERREPSRARSPR